MKDLNYLKGKVIVSVQAMPNEPLYDENCMLAMMKSVVNGGASALRLAGVRDVKNAKNNFDIPVIGITKPNKLPDNWKEVVYITPTITDVNSLIEAGADIIAFDGTLRPRECSLSDIISTIHSANCYAMADISTLEEGISCADLGADIISTTLAGYTEESRDTGDEPDFLLLADLVKHVEIPVILEGRIWSPKDVIKAFEIGAHSVVIGSAITRPQLITKRFADVLKGLS